MNKRKWTWQWPAEPGYYLYYGGFMICSSDFKPSLRLCRVSGSANGRLVYTAGTHFLYPSEQRGVFCKLDIELPDLDAIPGEPERNA